MGTLFKDDRYSLSHPTRHTKDALWYVSLNTKNRAPALTRQAHEAQIQAHDPQRELQKAKFMSNVERLETEESELKSCIQDSNGSIQSLSLEIESLQRELAILEREERIESEAPPNQEMYVIALTKFSVKLSIYRSLGIDLLENATGDAFTQCQIRSSPKNDIHTLDFDPKFSRFFYANLLWDMCT